MGRLRERRDTQEQRRGDVAAKRTQKSKSGGRRDLFVEPEEEREKHDREVEDVGGQEDRVDRHDRGEHERDRERQRGGPRVGGQKEVAGQDDAEQQQGVQDQKAIEAKDRTKGAATSG